MEHTSAEHVDPRPAEELSFHAVALDMDGTTLNSQTQMTLPTIHAIRRAAQKIKVIIATGRPSAALQERSPSNTRLSP